MWGQNLKPQYQRTSQSKNARKGAPDGGLTLWGDVKTSRLASFRNTIPPWICRSQPATIATQQKTQTADHWYYFNSVALCRKSGRLRFGSGPLLKLQLSAHSSRNMATRQCFGRCALVSEHLDEARADVVDNLPAACRTTDGDRFSGLVEHDGRRHRRNRALDRKSVV